FLPITHLRLYHRLSKPLSLPQGIICILHSGLSQERRLTLRKSLIERCQFAQEVLLRPAIKDQVMEGEQQDMLLRCEPQQLRTHKRATHQIKRTRALRTRKHEHLALTFRQFFQRRKRENK